MYKNYEVWIIDGNSDDSTTTFLKTLSSPFYWISEKDSGIYDAMNKGIALSKGEWFYFLGADDQLINKTILNTLFSEKIPEHISLIAGSIVYDKKSTPFIYSKNKTIKTASWSYLMWIRNGLHHQGTFYRKRLFNKNRYHLGYKILSDYAFNISLFVLKNKCLTTDVLIAKCQGNGISKSGNFNMYMEEVQLKSDQSHWILKPLFFVISFTKYVLRKVIHHS